MKQKIITQDKKIYDALSTLKHFSEVVMKKPVNYKAIDIILKNNKDNLVVISSGDKVTLRKVNDFNFDVYLKRVWR